ncbi:(R)-mandelonitrile lyase [Duganella guangzhouensis]
MMMKSLALCCIALLSLGAAPSHADDQVISTAASRTSMQGSSAYFTGKVRIDPLFPPKPGMAASGGYVTFAPGARSAWHTHPIGQYLVVTAGTGWTQQWGGPVVELHVGDVLWCPPGVKHWHGATPTTSMTHMALTGTVDEKNVDWLEPVSDSQYRQFARSEPPNDDIRAVSPALAKYAQQRLTDEVWKRPDLSPRDRSIVTLSTLIARNQTTQLRAQMERALENGVEPGEMSELITHLAFYAGWDNAMAAVTIAKDVFAARGIKASQLPPASDTLLPIDEKAEAQRSQSVAQNFGAVAPGVVQYTGELLFHELWLRPALAPRDRSLVTVSALIANGQVAQLSYHLNRAMDNGLTKAQAAEVLTQMAFYAGWPNVFSALPVVKEVFAGRPL